MRATYPSTIDRLLDRWGDHHPDRVAHLVHDADRLTYGQWSARARAVAARLSDHGVRAGARVALAFPREAALDFAVCLAAVHRLGAVAVLVSPDDRTSRRRVLTAAVNCEFLISPEDAAEDYPGVRMLVVKELLDGVDEEARTGDAPQPAAEPDAVATVVFTSGTTGTPKAVAMTHRDIMYAARPSAITAGPADEVLLHAFPLFVPVGQWATQVPLLRGVTGIRASEFDPATFLRLVEKYRVTESAMVPATAAAMAGLLDGDRPDTSSLRRLTIGSARCPVPALEALRALFPAATVVIDYSSTESGWAGTMLEYGPGYEPGAVGFANPGSAVRVVGEDERILAPGEVGVVELRIPPNLPARFYLDDPQATAATFRGDWVRMADLGQLDERGCLHLVARTREFVNISGQKVSCPEVERVLESFPGVREAAVFPVSDPILGEDLGAAVQAARAVEPEGLRRHAADRLAPYQVPSHVMVLVDLPRTPSGKVDKEALGEMMAARLAPTQEMDAAGPAPTSDVDVTRPTSEVDVARALQHAITRVTGSEEVALGSSFAELGLSSVEVIRVYHKLGESLGGDLDIVLMFEPVPLARLAEMIAEQSVAEQSVAEQSVAEQSGSGSGTSVLPGSADA
ncbi:acyl--CoA ligase [Plantactinospora sp. S1510]|uniref:Acyl--CoA ligase n=1 Tax=Plantactinospora alkalitolerans TaxID=2789879 RepID=A0ABS0GQR4_9ACTN|nr:class I adenylate-forming enzyme family protein [Plantactinospora alkalitolerans]MBF9128539.1 acyl--CoA ligase [Plantactinospora alkalitolerans]